jgi:HEAT repeat protein
MKKQSVITTVMVTATLIICLSVGHLTHAETADLNGRMVYNIGESKDPARVDQLLAVLDSSDDHLRRIAVRALGKIANEKAIEPLMEILENKSERPMVRSEAAWALGALKAGKALAALSCCLKDNPWVCLEARKAIHKITKHYSLLASL